MSPKRVLLVDDYPDALEIWGLYLRTMGYEVVTADDGLKAVDEAHQHLPDVIVLDLELPGITGFEAAIRLRNADDTAEIPLIAATGYSHVRQLNQARDAGFDSIIVKPCEPQALVAEIERLLEQDRDEETCPVIGGTRTAGRARRMKSRSAAREGIPWAGKQLSQEL